VEQHENNEFTLQKFVEATQKEKIIRPLNPIPQKDGIGGFAGI